jgi:hypothetical protein
VRPKWFNNNNYYFLNIDANVVIRLLSYYILLAIKYNEFHTIF